MMAKKSYVEGNSFKSFVSGSRSRFIRELLKHVSRLFANLPAFFYDDIFKNFTVQNVLHSFTGPKRLPNIFNF